MTCPDCGGVGTYPVISNNGFGLKQEWVPHKRNYAIIGDRPARACKKCHLIHCNEITPKKVYELNDLISYMRSDCNLNKDEERSLRKILSNRNGSKRSFFKRNMKGIDLDNAVDMALSMIRN